MNVEIIATKRGGDTIKFTVLDDGSLKAEAGKVSMANHGSAEAVLAQIAMDMGGGVVVSLTAPHAHHGHTHNEHEKE